MYNINRIIDCVDLYIEKTGNVYITPVMANKILNKSGLLKVRLDRPGAPLRILLRAGLIPHAYQPNGKNSRWRIPHS